MNAALGNGGFPLPAGPERVVESRHAWCAGQTRFRLPAVLPLQAVRRVVCENCSETYEVTGVSEMSRPRFSMPALALPRLSMPAVAVPSLSIPDPRALDRRWLTLPIAGLAVFVVLNLVRGNEAAPTPPAAAATHTGHAGTAQAHDHTANGAKESRNAPVPTDAQLVSESTFSLALPGGWDRIPPSSGATFAAVSSDGTADATLWIQNDPKLDMATFEANSLEQLGSLAGSAKVVDRELGPTAESTSITLAPVDPPAGSPTYEVVLRGSGNNWYYLATTHQATAPADAISGVDLIQGSFLPVGGKG